MALCRVTNGALLAARYNSFIETLILILSHCTAQVPRQTIVTATIICSACALHCNTNVDSALPIIINSIIAISSHAQVATKLLPTHFTPALVRKLLQKIIMIALTVICEMSS